ncbi:MAG: transketolase family protein [Peptococcaceae bacterium]|jgi:transketolase|nr:transketolase family protein [Peptococcaceae bacterium]
MEKQATREAYGQALEELGAVRQDVVVLDADLSKSTKTSVFQAKYPERFFNAGIAEQNLMGLAAGFAAAGKVPFASTFAVFATGRAYDQIRNSICYPRLNVKIAATHAGITVGEDGGSHQALEDINLMRGLPNMTVLVPADGPEAKNAVKAAADYEGPVYIRLGRSGVPTITDADVPFVIGKGRVMREGADVTLIGCGMMVAKALEAADVLAAEGVNAAVIDMSTIKPIDRELIVEWAKKTGAIVTAEEHNVIGGLGSAVAEVLVEEVLVPMERVGIEDVFGESGTGGELVEKYRLTAEHIVEKAKRAIARK